ncbi:CAP domain-containing protein [Nocardia sp. NPDC058666]|uniref:CAP domain-containing protein n=1 Tax=Nocardia sp. NPDC058666 TaxID=3346587 RepID=UPI0036511498
MRNLRKTLVIVGLSAALASPAAAVSALPLPIPIPPFGSAGAGSAGAGSSGSADQMPPGSAEEPQQPMAVQDAGTMRAQVLGLVNAERGQHGCAPLQEDSRLAAAAQAHADDMAARGYFSHSSPEGLAAADRVAAAGYAPAQIVAENLAGGQQTAQDVVATWMGSVEHRANIVNCQLVDTGVGVGFGAQGPQWVQDFGTL